MENGKKARLEFQNLLEETNYFFEGRIISINEIGRGAAFLCLEKLDFNIQGEKELVFRNQVVAKLNSTGHISTIGQVSFTDSQSKPFKVRSGDVVKFNIDKSGTYEIIRNNKVIYETPAIVNNPDIQDEFLDFAKKHCGN
jgi:hypothetical protein